MKKNIMIIAMGIIILACIVISLSFAYFTMTTTITNSITYNTTFDNGYNLTVDVSGNANEVVFGISEGDMLWSMQNKVAASSSTTFDINLVNGSSGPITCAYDYVWIWESGYDNYALTTGATLEFVAEVDGASIQVPNYTTSETKIGSGYITALDMETANKRVDATVKFYNLTDYDQSAHRNKQYKGHIAVKNAVCGVSLADYIANNAPRSGTSSVGSTPWILTSDRTDEYRYAGKNPDNYITINGELWRIIGVMPNMQYSYDENSPKTAGSLVKVIRNNRHGAGAWASASNNDWAVSTLPTTLDNAYGSFDNVVYVTWPLYGVETYNTSSKGTAGALYNAERNIDGAGGKIGTMSGSWNGRVGLMYPSDYGYATNGNGATSGTYSRSGCLSEMIYNWGDGDYKTYCSSNAWLLYSNATSSSVGTAYSFWTVTAYTSNTSNVMMISGYGYTGSGTATQTSYSIRPVVYLGPSAIINGGTGTFADPYTLK